MPPGLAEKLNLRAGDDRGRIYRVRRRGVERTAFRLPTTKVEQVELLSSSEGWCRDLGFRLLRTWGDDDVVEALRRLLTTSLVPMARHSAMDLLSLIGELDGTLIRRMMKDTDAHVRRRAWQYAISSVPGDFNSWKDLISEGMADEDERVRVAAIRTLSRLKIESMAEPIESFVLSETLGTLVWESVRGDLTRLAPKLCERIARRELSMRFGRPFCSFRWIIPRSR